MLLAGHIMTLHTHCAIGIMLHCLAFERFSDFSSYATPSRYSNRSASTTFGQPKAISNNTHTAPTVTGA